MIQNLTEKLRPPPLDEEFVRETDDETLARVRIGVVLGLVFIPLFTPLDWIRLPEHFFAALAIRLAGCATLAVIYFVARASWARGWSVGIVFVSVTVISLTILGIGRLSEGAHDPVYLVQAMALIFLVTGAGLLLPIDALTMLRVGAVPLVLQFLFTLDYDPGENLPVLASTLTALAVAVIGVRWNFQSRLGEYEGRRAQRELAIAKADFVAMLTHDIKNPLGAIGGLVEILRDGSELSGEGRDLLNRIEAASHRALMLATNFLDVSRIEQSAVTLRLAPTDLAQVLRHVLHHQRALADARRVRLVEDLKDPLPELDADEALLDRVFANIVNNAIKFTPANGEVRVTAFPVAQDAVEVIVEDTGIGLPETGIERLFERYSRFSTRADSTGMGLFVVKTLSEAHGGKVTASNRTDRQGAVFRVRLPLAASLGRESS